MRLAVAAFLLLVSLSASAQQERFAGVTLASGYATGFEAGAVHTEARVRVALSERVSVEPMASWTRGFAFGAQQSPACIDALDGGPVSLICAGPATRSSGADARALGAALTYRTAGALPLGLDGVHAGLFVQSVGSLWGGQRMGTEVGAEARIGRSVSIGADVQAAYFNSPSSLVDGFSVAPLLRVSVGR